MKPSQIKALEILEKLYKGANADSIYNDEMLECRKALDAYFVKNDDIEMDVSEYMVRLQTIKDAQG
jgi:hypothetical protein